MDTDPHAALSLALTPGLGPRKTRGLLERFGSPEDVLAASDALLRRVPGIKRELVDLLRSRQTVERVKREVRLTKEAGVDIIPWGSPCYPDGLRTIYDPPLVLYLRGSWPWRKDQNVEPSLALAIVGTRNASPYGLAQAASIAREVASNGALVVSGLALGIDSAAHRGALEASGGTTIAVLANGLDQVYPAKNRELASEIIASGGALVSEYPLGTRPLRHHFPARNRILNGLCHGVLVVEASEHSGALITAEYAMEEGRPVMAVPGRAGDPRAVGCLSLLRDGAALVAKANDVFDELSWSPHIVAEAEADDLTDAEHRVLVSLRNLGCVPLDLLLESTGMPPHVLAGQLATLSLKGYLQKHDDGRYQARAVQTPKRKMDT
ncbi:MAG: DNA-processing protein DprA [Trueperaceae bacterium]|nr:MAG: DNA-processing protein DprA [Trueperaceae bacterium]